MTHLKTMGGAIYFDRLMMQSDLTAIAQILRWFEQFRRPPLSQAAWLQGQIALVEGFTNAVRHAHTALPLHTLIQLEAGLYPDHLEIRIWDQGSPFDLEDLLDQVEQEYPNPLEHSEHWGGTLFKKLRDQHQWEIEYHCVRERVNCLCLVKKCDNS
ncbi:MULTISPECIES: ATP-binding protein [Leptolyngbya]|uniref:Anti-sigma regulatory factor, Ser/Thr protein kinase n=2 Tax=Leptolyngbya boryana TaxID=1184 RepID=A0A1Z4JDD2_LEPBY|nr:MULTISPECIES: anti-sigma regulatory factor [Leptolyngbya]BAY54804.1 anti-sigma regulatory factor, Ser/Thr protein kinase [Leptolyngbya boryana NIES-2135]MBD2365786.1 anti-sigma regulatory factor [Leptolyngbya sp. FACHB-161]MBD2371966.1 anti-sigma regulatory factor [Leptolyngbya sp. FACHB-238]MBD2396391.1 anti-sigma regulatory factor [Leptolyngbya sp. FACHB-239]MBD2402913.1 anti-sigma regulatory factor [Leptolyngbya sp. FACHB-402]